MNISKWEEVKDSLIIILRNKNDKRYSDRYFPKMEKADLTLLCAVRLDKYTILPVTGKLLEQYGVSEDDLFSAAIANSPRLMPETVFLLEDAVGAEEALPLSVIVVTNKEKWNGASVLFYEGVFDVIREHVGTDFYLLPSSIHEWMIVPKIMCDVLGLTNMVKSVNESESMDEYDVLSDNVYQYNYATDSLEIAV